MTDPIDKLIASNERIAEMMEGEHLKLEKLVREQAEMLKEAHLIMANALSVMRHGNWHSSHTDQVASVKKQLKSKVAA